MEERIVIEGLDVSEQWKAKLTNSETGEPISDLMSLSILWEGGNTEGPIATLTRYCRGEDGKELLRVEEWRVVEIDPLSCFLVREVD